MSENFAVKLATQQFATNLELKLQQTDSRLSGRVSVGSHVGKLASPVNQIGSLVMTAPAGRFSPLNREDADFTRRWCVPLDKEMSQLIDNFDLLKSAVTNPQSAEVATAAAAANRAKDDEIIRAATADALIGVDSGALTTETFNTTAFRVADTFGSTAASGLTVAKLKETRRIFGHYEVDPSEQKTLVAGSQQESDLLNEIEVVSLDYNDRPTLMDGTIMRFLGFDFVWLERLPTYTTTTRGVLAFVKSGIHLGVWQDIAHNISQETQLSSQPWQIYTKMSIGATRTQPGKVIQIACKDATGGPING